MNLESGPSLHTRGQRIITLLSPQIPQNTGNIARLCVVTNTKLHLVGRLGFELTDKYLKRAAMDYWKDLDYTYYPDLDQYIQNLDFNRAYLFTTKTKKIFTDLTYSNNPILIFGNETIGCPPEIQKLFNNRSRELRIPMRENQRCINLAVSAGIALYEVLRQEGFVNLV